MKNDTTTHPKILRDLKALADNELSLARRLFVRAHLAWCASCRQELTAMESVTNDLRAATSGDAAAALAPDLRAKLLASAAHAPTKTAPLPLWRARPLPVFGTALAATLAAGAVFAPMFAQTRQTALSSESRTQTRAAGSADPGMSMQHDGKRLTAGDINGNEVSLLNGAASADSALASPPSPMLRQAPAPRAAYELEAAAQSSFTVVNAITERTVHREASLGIAVRPDEIEPKSNRVEEAVKAAGGYVASNNLSTGDDGFRAATLDVRVPVDQFDALLNQFAKLGKMVSKNVSGEDITEKLSDAQTAEQVFVNEARTAERRLRSASMSERRLGQKEAELRQIRVQLAQTRARLGLLRRLGALASISVQIIESPKAGAIPVNNSGFWGGMRETNRAATLAFQTAVRVPLVLVMWVLAFSPIWAPLLVAYRWASRRRIKGVVHGDA